jgi:hypothetical protein
MKALTLTQPYATLIAIGAKRIETRSWSTRYRGPLAIHAGKGLGPVGGERGLVALYQDDVFAQALKSRTLPPRGVIVAVCNLVGITNTEAVIDGYRVQRSDRGHVVYFSADSERAFGDYTPGRYAWLLADVRPIDPPIPATGRQGLWEWECEAGW